MTDNFNPYQPPMKSGRVTEPGKRLSILDWVLAIVLGGLALFVTFFSTCFAVALSFLASGFDVLAPFVMFFSFLFSTGIGYSAAANYLAQKARKARQAEPSVAGMRSFQLERSYRKPTNLDQLIAGCGMGLLALLVLMPSTCFLLDQLSETLRLSEKATENTRIVGPVSSLCLSQFIGWRYWRRVSSR